jgi:4-amino-4-deoxy-L-arabinose transferase-like glycosyltransferase
VSARGPEDARLVRAGALVVAAALALRITHVLTIRHAPLFDVLTLDAESYDAWARRIAAGEWTFGRPFYQAPLYAYFLAGLHALSGGGLLLPRIANALLGTLHVALVLALGRRTFGPRAGLVAAALCAVHGTFLFEEGKVTKTTLGVVLATGTLLLLTRARHRGGAGGGRLLPWFAAGLAGAAAALVRENFLLFVAAAVVWAAWRYRRAGARPAAAIAAGTACGLLPSTLHNFAYDHELLPITSQAGQNFYTGVHPGNAYGGYLVPDFVRRSPRFEETDFAREAERRAGHRLTPGEVSRYWFARGLACLRDDPARLPRLFLRKLGLLFHDFEIPDDEDVRFFRRWAPVLRLPLPGFGVFAVLGLAGLGLAVVRRRAPPELVLFVVTYSVSVALFFVFSRYRLALVAPLSVFAGYLVVAGADAARAGRWRAVALGAAACVPLAAIAYRPLGETVSLANSYLSLGIGMEVKDRPGEAMAAYRAGLALAPDDAKLLRRAARLASDAAVRGGDAATADEALDLLRRAVAANPADAELRFRLGTLLGGAGRLDEAARAFEEVLRLGEEPPGVHANLALAYARLGRTDAALRHARRALERSPGDEEMRDLVERLSP